MRQLRELCHLCDIGGVTEEEFTRERAKLLKFSALLNDVFYEVPFSVHTSNPVCVHSSVGSLLSFWSILIIFRFSGVLFAFQSPTLEESTPSSRLF